MRMKSFRDGNLMAALTLTSCILNYNMMEYLDQIHINMDSSTSSKKKLWLVQQNKILTNDNIIKRKW
jgi:hypothetical protein